ncbi:MAG TPA: trimethylamine methyltransferase family protein [Actinomycetota bacterium]|nr:trimethylamine methyltransferase family protein [Actinomycetota bacterium]
MPAINALRQQAPTTPPGARVLPLRRGPGVDVLRERDLERIHDAAFRVLDDLGVRVGSHRIRGRLKEAGAHVGPERAHLPRPLVDEALWEAPRELVLAARDPSADLRVGAGDGWLGTGGPAERTVDLRSDERRASTLADVADVARLADALPQVGYLGPSVRALDLAAETRAPRELHVRFANTSKHVQVEVAPHRADVEACLEIARLAAGADLRQRPVVSALLRVRGPLGSDGERLEVAAALAQAGIPVGVVAEPIAGATAPATLAGALVTALAETVAGLAILQLLAPGTPVFIGTDALRVTMLGRDPTPGGASDPLFQLAWVQLARRVGLPAHVGAFATGSRSSDWQAGIEGGLSATAAWMAGPDLLAAAGMRGGGRVFSPIAMLLDTELFDLVRRIPLGSAADDEALAVEVIEGVGPGGHFLGEAHTLRHMREAWMSRFMDTDTWEAWEEAGRPQPPERAHARALELLETHEPLPLEPAVEERIREVIAEHERHR